MNPFITIGGEDEMSIVYKWSQYLIFLVIILIFLYYYHIEQIKMNQKVCDMVFDGNSLV